MSYSRKHFLESIAIGSGAAMGLPLLKNRNDQRNTDANRSVDPSSFPVMNVKEFGARGDDQTDDTEAIQAALTAARDRKIETVYVPEGVYRITEILIIYENTSLHLDKHAVIIRKADINAMLINGTEYVYEYDGQSNITVEGGTWDANSREFASAVTPLGFGHARNITVQNLTVLDVYDWHHLEINAIDGATIRDCLFDGMILTRAFTEMVQIDLMGTQGMFPWFGEFDNTTCRNVIIDRCIFQNGDTAGIGTHSTREESRHDYITITNCEFINLDREGIVGQNWEHTHIANNLFRNCNQGVLLEVLSDTDCVDLTIANNKFVDVAQSDESTGIEIRSEIKEDGEPGGAIRNVLIQDNFLSGVGKHGIHIKDCDQVAIRGNRIEQCDRSGIWTQNCNDTSVIANSAHGNARQDSSQEKDIRINSSDFEGSTSNTIITNNQVETCRTDAVEQCLLTNNIITNDYTAGREASRVRDINNYISGQLVD